MDRWASGIDTAWLQLEQETNRMVVHGVLFCAGPLDLAELRERVRRRWVEVYPGLRQRPTWPLGPLGPARWVDAPPDLGVHVRTVAVDAPGDDAALARHIGSLMSTPLPADRPWWSLHLLSGYRGPDGDGADGSALVVSIHHGLGDGVALNHLFQALNDTPAPQGAPAAYAEPPRRPHQRHDLRLVRRGIGARSADLWGKVRRASSPEGAAELAATGRAVGSATVLLTRPPDDPSTALQGELGHAKSARWTTPVPLETVRGRGKALGASVNDVLCAAIAEALREFLSDGAGAGVPRLRAVMPTNLRPLDRPISDELGNEVGLVLPSLPTDEPDADRRVERMHRTMSSVKRTDQALVIFSASAAAGHGRPAWTRALVARYARTASVIISNVPGPVGELTVAGTRVRDALFWVPCSGRLALGVSILSYAGQVRLGVRADTGVLGGEAGVDRFTAALDDVLTRM